MSNYGSARLAIWPIPCAAISWQEPVHTHHSAAIKQWCFINHIWDETQTRRVNSAVLTQVMANSLMHFITLGEHKSVRSRKNIIMLSIVIKRTSFKTTQELIFFVIFVTSFSV